MKWIGTFGSPNVCILVCVRWTNSWRTNDVRLLLVWREAQSSSVLRQPVVNVIKAQLDRSVDFSRVQRSPFSVTPHLYELSQFPSLSIWPCLWHCWSWSRWHTTSSGCWHSPACSAAGDPGPCPQGSWCRLRPGSPGGSGYGGSEPSLGCGNTWRTGQAWCS